MHYVAEPFQNRPNQFTPPQVQQGPWVYLQKARSWGRRPFALQTIRPPQSRKTTQLENQGPRTRNGAGNRETNTRSGHSEAARTGKGQDTREKHVSPLTLPVLGSAPSVCCSVLGSAPEGSALNPPAF